MRLTSDGKTSFLTLSYHKPAANFHDIIKLTESCLLYTSGFGKEAETSSVAFPRMLGF